MTTISESLRNRLNTIAERASKFTGRALSWSIQNGEFRLGDDTLYGNLCLVLTPYGIHEAYMRTRHFGLTWEDELVIREALEPFGKIELS